MSQANNNVVRIHRVGSITAGASMIVWGILFALYEINILKDLIFVLRLWPLILIGLGIEILWFSKGKQECIYDKGAIFIMILMSCFSMLMACGDMCIRYAIIL